MMNWWRSFEFVRGGCWVGVDDLGVSCFWVLFLMEDGFGDCDIFLGCGCVKNK